MWGKEEKSSRDGSSPNIKAIKAMDWVKHSDNEKFFSEPKWRTGQPVRFQFLCSENGGIMNQLLKAVRTIRHHLSLATHFFEHYMQTSRF